MVPYTLSKRRQKAIAAEKKAMAKTRAARVKPKCEEDRENSDSDDEPVSFFSHLDGSRPDLPSEEPTDSSTDIRTPAISTLSSVALGPSLGSQTSAEATGYQSTASGYHYTGRYGSNFQVQDDQSIQGYPNEYSGSMQGYPSGYGNSVQGYIHEYDGSEQEYTSESTEKQEGEASQEGGEEEQPMPIPGPGLSIDEQAVST